MKGLEIITQEGNPAVHLRTATRAGLISAAIGGLFEVVDPVVKDDSAMPEEREFAVKGKDFTELFHRLMNEVIILGRANNEAYEGIRLTLITETEAKGALLGKVVKKRKMNVSAAALVGGAVAKNDAGLWDVTVMFSAKD